MPPPHLDPKLQLFSELAAPAANREPAPGQEFGERELFEIWVLKVGAGCFLGLAQRPLFLVRLAGLSL